VRDLDAMADTKASAKPKHEVEDKEIEAEAAEELEVQEPPRKRSKKSPTMALARSNNGFFDGFFDAMPLARMSSSDWPVMKSGLSMDMVEKEDKYVAHVDVPGVPKEDVHLSVEEDILTVSADYKRENVKKEDGDRVHWVERSSGHVSRSIKLPESVDVKAISASQKDGVLEILIPKKSAEEKKSVHRIAVN